MIALFTVLAPLGSVPALAQTVPNGSFEPDGRGPAELPSLIPPAIEWALEADDLVQVGIAAVGMPVYCDEFVTVESPFNTRTGGAFFAYAEGIDLGNDLVSSGALSIEVPGLDPAATYRVRFEASALRQVGQSSGFWRVSFGNDEVDTLPVALPGTTPGQQSWVDRWADLQPGQATATLRFAAVSEASDTTVMLPNACGYASVFSLTQLLLDGVVLVADLDGDGLFDDEDPCPREPGPGALASGDHDQDGLLDTLESVIGTDPCLPDSDGDGLLDGEEIDLQLERENPAGCPDPLDADSDGDGVEDGDEVAGWEIPLDCGTTTWPDAELAMPDLCAIDEDHDGLTDEEERDRGTDPTLLDTDGDGLPDRRDTHPVDCSQACNPTSDVEWWSHAGWDELRRCCEVEEISASCDEWDSRKIHGTSSLRGGRCGCQADGGASGGLVVLVLGLLAARRRQ